MDKVLVNLSVPALGEKYDVNLPTFLTVKEISELLAKLLEEVTMRRYVSSGQEFLCSIDRNVLFREELTPADYGVQTGEHLMFC